MKNANFFLQKFANIAENCDHNIEPGVQMFSHFPTTGEFPNLSNSNYSWNQGDQIGQKLSNFQLWAAFWKL
jgi:hypothetical protein